MQLQHASLIAALRSAAEQTPATKGYTFLSQSEPTHLSFAALWREAQGLAAMLQERGIKQGDRVLVTLPTSPDFARLYLALHLCGAAPCVLPTATDERSHTSSRRIVAVAQQIEGAAILLPAAEIASFADASLPCPLWACEQLAMGDPAAWRPVHHTATDLALIQATSGSTGAPKCVGLTHDNVLTNLEQIGRRLQIGANDVQVCWLPLFHDMGLMGCFLLTLYWQMQCVLLTSFQFVRNPLLWLKALSDYKGTISPAPTFAYALTARRVHDADLPALDLSHWKAAVCGAEPIDVAVLQRFAQRLHGCGLRPHALAPAYGMAEAGLCITMSTPDEPCIYESISRRAMATTGQALPVASADADAAHICDCGAPVEGTHIRIIADDGHLLPDGCIGRIWVAGPSIMSGYLNLPEVTAELLQDGWLDTGDLGYLRHGRLFVTGRAKELIIIRGQNYPPTDFEWAAEEVPGVTPGRVIAFGVPNRVEGTEEVVLLCEESRDSRFMDGELQRAIQTHVGKRIGILPAAVVLTPRNSIPRTSSGKPQRHLAKLQYLASVQGR
jgi:acyl-CoA synthetase (AMP-forming)/AMP-acid ligase II